MSRQQVCMLDLHVFKGSRFERSGILDIKLYLKPSAQGCPLASDSYHPPNLHFAWPTARFSHFDTVSTSRAYALMAKTAFFEKLAVRQPGHSCLPFLASLFGKASEHTSKAHHASSNDGGCSWLVLPYFRGYLSLTQRLRAVHKTFTKHGFEHLIPRISWALHGSNLLQVTLRDTSDKLKLSD